MLNGSKINIFKYINNKEIIESQGISHFLWNTGLDVWLVGNSWTFDCIGI